MIEPWFCAVRLPGFSDGPALVGLADAPDLDLAGVAVDRDLGARRDVRALLRAARQADADVRLPLLRAVGPVEALGRLLEHRPQARVFEVGEAERQRVLPRRLGQLVHEALAGEVVGRGRQRPVRAVPQRGVRLDELALLLARAVRRLDRRRAGVDVDEVPARQHPLVVEARLGVDHRRGAEVGPGELLLARPAEADRLARGLGQPGRLDGALAGVLPAEAAAEIGDDHADLVVRAVETPRRARA